MKNRLFLRTILPLLAVGMTSCAASPAASETPSESQPSVSLPGEPIALSTVLSDESCPYFTQTALFSDADGLRAAKTNDCLKTAFEEINDGPFFKTNSLLVTVFKHSSSETGIAFAKAFNDGGRISLAFDVSSTERCDTDLRYYLFGFSLAKGELPDGSSFDTVAFNSLTGELGSFYYK
ncbi:MAG: hypothetical protein WCS90_02085 [Bacilli bacterium]